MSIHEEMFSDSQWERLTGQTSAPKNFQKAFHPEDEPKEVNKKTTIEKLKKGELFKLSESETAPVWIRGEYVRSEKKYSCTKFDDINHENWFKGSEEVFIDFEF